MKPMAQKSTSAAIFTKTMIVLTTADSRAPPSRKTIASRTTTRPGRLMKPPSPGAEETAAGRVTPIVPSSSSLRYSPQPTATAATETPYSRTRHQPQTQATSSPIVAYAYEYEEPATGMEPASSAYERAENRAARPATTKARVTAGPASGTASPRTTKMPVPSVAPMLIMVSCHIERERRRLPPSPCPPSATRSSTGLRRVRAPRAEGLGAVVSSTGGAAPWSSTAEAPYRCLWGRSGDRGGVRACRSRPAGGRNRRAGGRRHSWYEA